MDAGPGELLERRALRRVVAIDRAHQRLEPAGNEVLDVTARRDLARLAVDDVLDHRRQGQHQAVPQRGVTGYVVLVPQLLNGLAASPLASNSRHSLAPGTAQRFLQQTDFSYIGTQRHLLSADLGDWAAARAPRTGDRHRPAHQKTRVVQAECGKPAAAMWVLRRLHAVQRFCAHRSQVTSARRPIKDPAGPADDQDAQLEKDRADGSSPHQDNASREPGRVRSRSCTRHLRRREPDCPRLRDPRRQTARGQRFGRVSAAVRRSGRAREPAPHLPGAQAAARTRTCVAAGGQREAGHRDPAGDGPWRDHRARGRSGRAGAPQLRGRDHVRAVGAGCREGSLPGREAARSGAAAP